MALMSLLSGYDNPGEKTGKKTGKKNDKSEASGGLKNGVNRRFSVLLPRKYSCSGCRNTARL
jgi:hypothetical protein